jgi:hypothetical protein
MMETENTNEYPWAGDLFQSLQEVLNLLSEADIIAKEKYQQDSNSELRKTIQKAELLLLSAYSRAVEQSTEEMKTKLESVKNEEGIE